MIADDLVAAVCESIDAMTLDLSASERIRAYVRIQSTLEKLVADVFEEADAAAFDERVSRDA